MHAAGSAGSPLPAATAPPPVMRVTPATGASAAHDDDDAVVVGQQRPPRGVATRTPAGGILLAPQAALLPPRRARDAIRTLEDSPDDGLGGALRSAGGAPARRAGNPNALESPLTTTLKLVSPVLAAHGAPSESPIATRLKAAHRHRAPTAALPARDQHRGHEHHLRTVRSGPRGAATEHDGQERAVRHGTAEGKAGIDAPCEAPSLRRLLRAAVQAVPSVKSAVGSALLTLRLEQLVGNDDEDDGTGTSADPRAVLPLRFKVERRGRFGRSGSSGSGGTSGGGTLKLITGVAYAMQLRLEPQWLELEDGVVELWLEGAEEVRGAWHVSVQRAWALCDRSKART